MSFYFEKKNNLIINLIFLICTFISISPALFAYYYDIPYLLISIYLFFYFYFKKVSIDFLFFFFLLFLFIFIKLLLNEFSISSFQGIHKGLADLRFLVFFTFALILLKNEHYSLNKLIFICTFVILLVNIFLISLALTIPEIYKQVINIYFGEYYSVFSTGMPVSLLAFNSGGRIQGLFLLPIFTGAFFITLSYLNLIYTKYINSNLLLFITIQAICFVSIYVSKSSIIWLYFSFFLFFYLNYNITTKLKIFLFLFFLISTIFTIHITNNFDEFLYFVNTELLGERFLEKRQMHQAWSRIAVDYIDIFLGFSPAAKGEYGKGFMDMSYNSRLVFGGLFYLIYFYGMVFYLFFKNFKKIWIIVLPLLLIGLAVDLGGSYFSEPQFGWLKILLIVSIFGMVQKKLDKRFNFKD